MKVTYICEVCGKEYQTPAEAKACENSHAEEKRKKELEAKREELRAKSSSMISDMINKHIEQFKDFPDVTISEKNTEILVKNAEEELNDAISDADWDKLRKVLSLFEGFLGDDEDDDDDDDDGDNDCPETVCPHRPTCGGDKR